MTLSQGLIPDRFRTLHLMMGTIARIIFLATGTGAALCETCNLCCI